MKKAAIMTAIVLGMVAVSGTAFAFNGGFKTENNEAVRDALKTNDYNAWRLAMEETLTEENFNQMVEMNQNRERIRLNMEDANQALENGDYDAWKAAMENCERQRTDMSEVTQEQFAIMMQIREARQNKDFDTAAELGQELGFDFGFGMGRMERKMRP
ncbi:MAG: hypothetical protein JW700_04050 [Candidatus Aenigmarchaeota archaeon]|nr:hypothetical protein [Candidatus Aenigmarchaeota archaeon]